MKKSTEKPHIQSTLSQIQDTLHSNSRIRPKKILPQGMARHDIFEIMSIRSGKNKSKERGALGESFACDLLQNKGYRIICRNWRCRWGEIDIIAEDGDAIVFVEVKSAKSKKFGNPARWVDSRKQSRLIKSAQQYILDEVGEDIQVRFDVIAVDLNEMDAEHIINAFSVGAE